MPGKPNYTLQELVDELTTLIDEGFGDRLVYLTSDYGDHCHTEQALSPREVTMGILCGSAYSGSGLAVDEDGGDTEDAVVLIRT